MTAQYGQMPLFRLIYATKAASVPRFCGMADIAVPGYATSKDLQIREFVPRRIISSISTESEDIISCNERQPGNWLTHLPLQCLNLPTAIVQLCRTQAHNLPGNWLIRGQHARCRYLLLFPRRLCASQRKAMGAE